MREKCPTRESRRNAEVHSGDSKAMSPNGMRVMSIAFSCTCHPKRKEHNERGTKAYRKVFGDGRCHTFQSKGAMEATVSSSVTQGGILGRTSVAVDPTSPLVEVGTLDRIFSNLAKTKSANMYRDQALGAQYACTRPLLNGNNRETS